MSRNNQAPALSPAQESAVYAAGQCVVETHRRLSAWLRAGLTLAEIDAFVADTLAELDCRSCFIGYRIPRHGPFPNHACLSVNECVVHGTSDSYTAPLRPGDVLKIDIGVTHQGWIGDAARTYVFGAMTPEVQKLTDCGKECIRRGLEQLRPGKRLITGPAPYNATSRTPAGFTWCAGWAGTVSVGNCTPHRIFPTTSPTAPWNGPTGRLNWCRACCWRSSR
jgi:methionyl aminopeptidase